MKGSRARFHALTQGENDRQAKTFPAGERNVAIPASQSGFFYKKENTPGLGGFPGAHRCAGKIISNPNHLSRDFPYFPSLPSLQVPLAHFGGEHILLMAMNETSLPRIRGKTGTTREPPCEISAARISRYGMLKSGVFTPRSKVVPRCP